MSSNLKDGKNESSISVILKKLRIKADLRTCLEEAVAEKSLKFIPNMYRIRELLWYTSFKF
jgi:hypothetical protein